MTRIRRVTQVARHRNGVAGNAFHAVRFDVEVRECGACGATLGSEPSCVDHPDEPWRTRELRMLGVVFEGAAGSVAVFDVDRLADPAVGVAAGNDSAGNSWHGDYYEGELRAAVGAWEAERQYELRAAAGRQTAPIAEHVLAAAIAKSGDKR